MAPFAVDPEALSAAGSAVVATGDGLNAAMTVLTAGFGANTGQDMAGEVFGLSYQSTAESLSKAATAVINACRRNGVMIQVDAANWSKAEAASTLGGGPSALEAPAEPAKVGAPGPPGTLGPGEPPPVLWVVVQSFVDDLWPNGDVAALHAAAGCWRTFGSAVSGMQGALNGSKTLVGTQQIPEGEKINQVLSQIGDAMAKLGDQCGKMASTLDGFANQVAQAQNDIRSLLHRLESLTDVWHDVISILDGDALEEIKKIAHDINAVLHDLGRQARAFEQGIKILMQVADGLVVDMEKFMRGQFTHFLGDAVGNQVATAFDTVVNANEGVVKEGVQTVMGLADLSTPWLLLDPKGAIATWKGMAESQFKASLLNEILHPQEGAEANLQMWKSLLHLDDWSTARPGLGFGENLFDVATLFTPGLGEAGAGAEAGSAAARGAEEAGEAAEGAGAAGRAGGLGATTGALGDIGKASTGLTKDLDNLNLNVPKTVLPAGGRPVGPPPPKPGGVPAESPRGPVESAPPGTPAPHSPTAPTGTPVGPREPAPAPAPAGGPHQPVPAPVPAGGPDEPAPAPVPAGGPHDPAPAPVPAGGPHEPASAPAGGPREPAPVPAEHLPSRNPQVAKAAPARVPVAADGAPLETAPAAAQSAQQAPALASAAPSASTPHFTPSSAPSGELPAPGGGGWRAPGEGGTPGGGPHDAPPGGGGPHGPGDGGPPGGDPHGSGDSHAPRDHTDGQPLDGDGTLDGPTDADGKDHGEPPKARDVFPDASEYGDLTQEQYEEQFLDADGKTIYPDQDDPAKPYAIPGTVHNMTPAEILQELDGKIVDRIGSPYGSWLAPDGTPYGGRALPAESLDKDYYRYEVHAENGLPPGWTIEKSEAAPWFGQPGGGIQYRLMAPEGETANVWELLDKFLKRI